MKGNNLLNIEVMRAATEVNHKNMVDSLPESLRKQQRDFFINMEKSQVSPLEKLEKLYNFMAVLYTHVNQYTPCKKGCSYCCSYYITISAIEIDFIEKNNKKLRRKKQFNTDNKGVGIPCLFLVNGVCSIYESRPYVCRRHVVLAPDNSVCTEDNAHTHKFQLVDWPELDKSYASIRLASGSNELYDIRDVFSMKPLIHHTNQSLNTDSLNIAGEI